LGSQTFGSTIAMNNYVSPESLKQDKESVISRTVESKPSR
jgi:hypothetical protein